MTPLVDVHAHFLTPWYVEAARAAGHHHPDGMPGWPDWSPDQHLRLMDAHGIDQAVLSISSPGVHFGDDEAAVGLARRVNDHAAQVCASHPDRFRFFGSLPLPSTEEALTELDRCLDELGAAGFVLETNVGGRYLSDPAWTPVLDELERRAAVLFLHPTSPPGHELTALGYPRPMLEFLVESTRAVSDLILRRRLTPESRLQLIVAHCGAFLPLEVDRLAMFARGLGLADVEPVRALQSLWFDLAGTPMPTHAEALMAGVGAQQVLYGSDHCWTPAPLVTAQIGALDADWPAETRGSWRELCAENATRLFACSAGSR